MATGARINILGVGVHPLNLRSALAEIAGAIAARRKGYVTVTGVHGVMEAQDDPGFRAILNGAFLTTPDGMPLVWLGRAQGFPETGRVYGPDLLLEVCRASEEAGWRHFFYGGAPGAAQELAAFLQARFPRLVVAGTHTPPFRPLSDAEFAALRDEVGAARPDIVWVGLSTPKQERFMAGALGRLDATLMFGIGAAFDLVSGRVRQAPRWIQRSGFEWLYRTFQEPRRLWRRYFRNNPRFVLAVLLQAAGLRRYPLD